MRSGSAPVRPELPLLIKAPPGLRGAAAPTTGQSARLGKEQPGETHAFRVAHHQAGPLTARDGSFRTLLPVPGDARRPGPRHEPPITAKRGHITRAGAFPANITAHSRNAAGQKK